MKWNLLQKLCCSSMKKCHLNILEVAISKILPLSSLVPNVCFTKCDQIETLLEISQLLLPEFLKIQVSKILQKAGKTFMTLISQSDQLQLLPRVETWVIQLSAGLYPRRLQTPAAALPSCLWTAAALQDSAQSPAPAPSLGARKWYSSSLKAGLTWVLQPFPSSHSFSGYSGQFAGKPQGSSLEPSSPESSRAPSTPCVPQNIANKASTLAPHISHQSASMVVLQHHCKIQQRLFVAPSALFHCFLSWKTNSLNQHFQKHLIFPRAIHIPGGNSCPDWSACRNFSPVWSARWKKTTVLKNQNMQTLFTIHVAPITYVVRKFISQHLSYGNWREKHASHLMHGSPLEDTVLLSLFISSPVF